MRSPKNPWKTISSGFPLFSLGWEDSCLLGGRETALHPLTPFVSSFKIEVILWFCQPFMDRGLLEVSKVVRLCP